MVNDRIPILRPTAELPKDFVGLKAVINGLKSLYPDREGHGPEIIQGIKLQVDRIGVTDAEREELERAFDEKLGELTLAEMGGFPGKRERTAKGFNATDREGHQRLLEMFLKYDIPELPFFSEERRAELLIQAQQKIWTKGFIPGERKE